MGEAPDWWHLMRAARYLGVPPWQLAEKPVFWMNAALTAQHVEAEYTRQEQERQNRQ